MVLNILHICSHIPFSLKHHLTVVCYQMHFLHATQSININQGLDSSRARPKLADSWTQSGPWAYKVDVGGIFEERVVRCATLWRENLSYKRILYKSILYTAHTLPASGSVPAVYVQPTLQLHCLYTPLRSGKAHFIWEIYLIVMPVRQSNYLRHDIKAEL